MKNDEKQDAAIDTLSPCELLIKMLFGPSDQTFTALEWEIIDGYVMRKDPRTLGQKVQDHIATLDAEDFGSHIARRLSRVIAIQKNRGLKVHKPKRPAAPKK